MPGRCAQADGDGHGLLVVEQQRRHGGARHQAIAAVAAHRRAYRIAEVAQPLDVAADGARADLQTRREFAARPVARSLEQGQQVQQSCRGAGHATKNDRNRCCRRARSPAGRRREPGQLIHGIRSTSTSLHGVPGPPARRRAEEKGEPQKEPPGGVTVEPADHGLGRSRGGLTTKPHLAVEQGQKPMSIVTSTRPATARNAAPTAAVRRSSTRRTTRLGTRSSAESTASRDTRAVATRYDKLAVRHEATVLVAAINEWL